MDAHNALQQMLRAPHAINDPGDTATIQIDRDRLYCSLNPAGTETRTLAAPPKPGLVAHLGCIAAQTVTVTVKEIATATNVLSTTGTITFTAAGQWIGLSSVELSAGVFAWQATDVYGCTTTIQTAGNWSAAVAAASMTTLVVDEAITAASIVNTTITAASVVNTALTGLTGVFKSINVSTGITAPAGTINLLVATSAISANSILATNVSVGTGLTAASILAPIVSATSKVEANSILVTNVSAATGLTTPRIVKGVHAGMTGGTAANSAQAITGGVGLMAFTASTNNFYALPTPTVGLVMEVINRVGSTAVLVGAANSQSIQGATSVSVATADAVGCASRLIADGTSWWKCPQ